MSNRHMPYDLTQMQSLPLEAKERMSMQRIKVWFESWKKYTIYDKETKKTRYVTHTDEPSESGCFVKKTKKVDGQKAEVDVLVKGTKLKPTEYIEAVEDGQVYVSFSGGKDSTVLSVLCAKVCKECGYSLHLLFSNTGLEYPEIQKFVKTFAEWLQNKYEIEVYLDVIRPKMRFDEVLKEYGYPVISKEVSKYIKEGRTALVKGNTEYYAIQKLQGRLKNKDGEKSIYNCEKWGFMLDAPYKISNQCCDVMKKRPIKQYESQTGRRPFIGTLASESLLRKQQWLINGCNAFQKERPSSQPLSFWTEQDILHYIKKYNVPYCSVYGDIVLDTGSEAADGQTNIIDFTGEYEPEDKLKTTGCDRTGCIFCMFGCHLEKEPNRFQRLKETHPRQYEYCIGGGEMVDGKWQPSKEGLGLGKVLDFIGVKYE